MTIDETRKLKEEDKQWIGELEEIVDQDILDTDQLTKAEKKLDTVIAEIKNSRQYFKRLS